MGNVSRGWGVRRWAYAGFVRVKTSFNAVNHTWAAQSAEDCPEVKRVAENWGERAGNIGDVSENNNKWDQNVSDAHKRNDFLGKLDNALSAADYAESHACRQKSADNDRSPELVVEVIRRKRWLQIVRAEQVKAEGVGGDEENAENCRDNRQVKRLFYIISRSAEAVAVLVLLLKNLRKRTLDKRRSRADNAHQPHPKARARSAEANRGWNADDVAGSHARSGWDHQRLERWNLLWGSRLFNNQLTRRAEQPYLYEFGAERKEKSRGGKNDDENRIIHYFINFAEKISDCLKHILHSVNIVFWYLLYTFLKYLTNYNLTYIWVYCFVGIIFVTKLSHIYHIDMVW